MKGIRKAAAIGLFSFINGNRSEEDVKVDPRHARKFESWMERWWTNPDSMQAGNCNNGVCIFNILKGTVYIGSKNMPLERMVDTKNNTPPYSLPRFNLAFSDSIRGKDSFPPFGVAGLSMSDQYLLFYTNERMKAYDTKTHNLLFSGRGALSAAIGQQFIYEATTDPSGKTIDIRTREKHQVFNDPIYESHITGYGTNDIDN